MNERSVRRGIALAALIVVALTPAIAAAAGTAGAPNADAIVELHGGLVTFGTPTSDDFVLVVAGDGYRSRERFAGGQTAAFTPVDRMGFSLPDGLYKWELILTGETPATAAAGQGKPEHGRAVHRVAAPHRGRQSGVFSIAKGRVVDSSLIEPPNRKSTPQDAATIHVVHEAVRHDDSDAAAQGGR